MASKIVCHYSLVKTLLKHQIPLRKIIIKTEHNTKLVYDFLFCFLFFSANKQPKCHGKNRSQEFAENVKELKANDSHLQPVWVFSCNLA